jgi:hypothetical protein
MDGHWHDQAGGVEPLMSWLEDGLPAASATPHKDARGRGDTAGGGGSGEPWLLWMVV